jgi:hypothetical protein
MNFFKHCFQNRWLRGLTWTLVSVVTLYGLICAWMNWSGAQQWSATQAMLKAEGETLDFRATMKDPIPEAENFCAIPLLKDIALAVDNDASKGAPAEKRKRLEDAGLPAFRWRAHGGTGRIREDRPRLTRSAELGKAADLKGIADWLRQEGSLPFPPDAGNPARELLSALAKYDSVVQELTAGLSRPKAQWTPEWKTRDLPEMLFAVSLPHYSNMSGVNQTLALRAIASARAGNIAKAHETALIIAKLSQANLNDPFLIGLLVGASSTAMLPATTWELCDAQAGTVEDFTKLESALGTLDFHGSALSAWRSEMAAGVNTLQFIKRKRDNSLSLFEVVSNDGKPSSSVLGNLSAHAIPSGFFDASSAVLVDREFNYLLKPLRDGSWLEARKAGQTWEKELIEMRKNIAWHPSYIMTTMIAPAFKSVLTRAIYTQVLVNQATIACALERYRLEKGNYPDSLDAVKLADGKPLPLDVINDKSMHYRKTTNGKYALWSVGFDGKDDGGKRMLDEKHPENTRFSDEKYLGDWVWDFPAK